MTNIVSQFRGNLNAVEAALSQPRFGTYLAAKNGVYEDAMDLYEWNAKASNALFFPMHVCEVSIRNAASEAIGAVFGPNWPYSTAFQTMLPSKGGFTFNPRRELVKVAAKYPASPGKVVADLKFVFWESVFTNRFDTQIWHRNINNVLPFASAAIPNSTPGVVRKEVNDALVTVRKIRNRIAHHEPIFSKNLHQVLESALNLISYRCQHTHQWVMQSEEASRYINNPV